MTYKKIDDNTIEETTSVKIKYNIKEKLDRKKGLENDIKRIQEEIDEIDILVSEAKKVGIKFEEI